jgi:hypothetical protein
MAVVDRLGFDLVGLALVGESGVVDPPLEMTALGTALE